MDSYKQNNLVKGALILTLAAFISKILSALYRIPLQNFSGDYGFYIYQQIYPLIGTVMILSLYSFPTAISKLSITMLEKERRNLSIYSFYLPVFIILIIINGLFFLFLIYFSPKLSHIIGDSTLESAFYIVSFAFLMVPFIALFRGVFQAYGNMMPTAFSQVIEQSIRVVIIIAISYLIYDRNLSVYLVGKFGAIATIAGSITALFILTFYFIKYKPYTLERHTIPWTYYIRTLLLFGFVAALNHMLLLMIQFADVLTLVPLLVDFGFSSDEAKEMKGIFDRGQPLIQFGTIVGSSFALALIPAMSNKRLEVEEVSDSILISFYIAAGATVGLIMLMPEANMLLFKNLHGTLSLRILVSSILLCSIIITVNALLQSLGIMIKTAIYIFFVLCLKVILNILIVPIWGLIGSALATVISLCVLVIVSFIELNRKTPQFNMLHIVKWRQFLLSVSGMIFYLFIFKTIFHVNMFQSRLLLLFYVCFLVITGAIIYLFILIRLNVLSNRQLNVLPARNVLMKFRRHN